MWVQLGSAPSHFVQIERTFLNKTNRLNSVAWPPNLLNQILLNFYLWGYLKNSCYKQQPTTQEDIIKPIQRACAVVARNVLCFMLKHFLEKNRTVSLRKKVGSLSIYSMVNFKRNSKKQGDSCLASTSVRGKENSL